jgi:hypothetical protein
MNQLSTAERDFAQRRGNGIGLYVGADDIRTMPCALL